MPRTFLNVTVKNAIIIIRYAQLQCNLVNRHCSDVVVNYRKILFSLDHKH